MMAWNDWAAYKGDDCGWFEEGERPPGAWQTTHQHVVTCIFSGFLWIDYALGLWNIRGKESWWHLEIVGFVWPAVPNPKTFSMKSFQKGKASKLHTWEAEKRFSVFARLLTCSCNSVHQLIDLLTSYFTSSCLSVWFHVPFYFAK